MLSTLFRLNFRIYLAWSLLTLTAPRGQAASSLLVYHYKTAVGSRPCIFTLISLVLKTYSLYENTGTQNLYFIQKIPGENPVLKTYILFVLTVNRNL